MKLHKMLLAAAVFSAVVGLVIFKTPSRTINSEPTPEPSLSETVQIFKLTQTITPDIANKETQRTAQIETKEYSFGTLVESIDGVKNGTDEKYWIFYINGEESKVGAAEYKPQAGDTIEWKYKTYEE